MYKKNPVGEWYTISNIDTIDSPALVLYEERIQENIRLVKEMIGDVQRLRPHVKTNKISEVSAMMLQAGITRFKCATIAEAEMLAMLNAPDVLLAYQPNGPKLHRFVSLAKAYPATQFSCLIDNISSAKAAAAEGIKNGITIRLFIDVNVGMNRTGIIPQKAFELAAFIQSQPGLTLAGLHGYDGHIRATNLDSRQQEADEAYKPVDELAKKILQELGTAVTVVMGGTPTFPLHAQRAHVECSPGTFIFNDWGYKHSLPDEPFEYAALVVSRVITIVDERTICTDLGHKSVAPENPLDSRLRFLNAPDVVFKGQSEEHLVLGVDDSSAYAIGDVLYGVPIHICPTVALYDSAWVAENNTVTKSWNVIARNRAINF